MQLLQAEAISITLVTFVLSLILAMYITFKWRKKKSNALLFWGSGLWVFSIGVAIEVVFASGAYVPALMSAYLFVVGLIVSLLSLGSIQMVKRKSVRQTYYAYCILTVLFLLYSVTYSGTTNLVVNYVVSGVPSNLVILASILVTFPASAVLVIMAALSYAKSHNLKLLSIIIGVVFVVIAGTLYIVSFPALLYISEFVGIVLIWFGFYSG